MAHTHSPWSAFILLSHYSPMSLPQSSSYISPHSPLPFSHGACDLGFDGLPRLVSVMAAGQELVIISHRVPDMRRYGKPDGVFVEFLRRGASADSAAVFQAGVLGDANFTPFRTTREQITNSLSELVDILLIDLLSFLRFALSAPLAHLRIVEAFLLSLIESGLFDQQSLPFVTLPRTAPLQDHGGERRVLPGTHRKRRVAGRQKDKMIEIRAGQAQRPFLSREENPPAPPKIRPTLVACRFTIRDEHLQIVVLILHDSYRPREPAASPHY